ncbi:hypothetical protein [Archaeoglobus sp.]
MVERISDYRVKVELTPTRLSLDKLWKRYADAMDSFLESTADPTEYEKVSYFTGSERPRTLKNRKEREAYEKMWDVIGKYWAARWESVENAFDLINHKYFPIDVNSTDLLGVEPVRDANKAAAVHGTVPWRPVLVSEHEEIKDERAKVLQLYTIDGVRAFLKARVGTANDPFARNTVCEYLAEEVIEHLDDEIEGSYAVFLDELYVAAAVSQGAELPRVHRLRAEQAAELKWLPVPASPERPEDVYALKLSEREKAVAFEDLVREFEKKGVERSDVVESVIYSSGPAREYLVLHLPSEEDKL